MDYKGKAYSLLQVKDIDEEERVIRGIATTPTPDRYDDVVVPEGAQFKTPMPLLLYHKGDMPVGSVTFAEVTKEGIPFEARIPKVHESGTIKDRVDEAWHSVKYKLLAAVSIGFTALADGVELLKTGGLKFNRWEWLELSLVSVPAQPEAVITSFKSMDPKQVHEALGTDHSNDDHRKAFIKSIDSKMLAASGNERTSPSSSRVRERTKAVNLLPNEDKTMNIAEQIKALESKRAANVAQMEKLAEAGADAGRSMDESESDQFDELSSELETIDKDLKRLKALEKFKAAEAKPVVADTAESGAASRKGITITAPRENLEPGINFARLAKCKAIAKLDDNFDNPRHVARSLYGENSSIFGYLQKAAVPAATTTDEAWAGFLVGDESSVFTDFVEFLRPQTILGRFGTNGVPALRSVPFRVRLSSQTSGGEGYWVGQGKAKPLTQFAGTSTTLEPLKVANIAVATMELLRDSSPSAERMIRDELAAALRARLDIDFIDPAKTAVANESPASITNGIAPLASSGCDADAIRCDISAAFGAFADASNPLNSGVWIMGSRTAIALWQVRNPLGQREFPDVTMTGGTFEGLPVIVSDFVPEGVVALVNAGDIWFADDGGISVDMSREASLEMDDAPSHDSDTPTPAALVSLWQTNSVGFRAERTVNWARRRDSGVVVMTGVDWGCCDES